MAKELWQLFDDSGKPIKGRGAISDDIFGKGLLHGASHVWITRGSGTNKQVLLQKRAAKKRTYPNLFDISAAGHIDLGETPEEAAVREAKEEIGLKIDKNKLHFIMLDRTNVKVKGTDATENEYRWVYLYEIDGSQKNFILQNSEVDSLIWKSIKEFEKELSNEESKKSYVPHSIDYYSKVISGLLSH